LLVGFISENFSCFIVYDTMVADVAMAAALTRSTSASGSAIMSGEALDSASVGSVGDRVCTFINFFVFCSIDITLLLFMLERLLVSDVIRDC